MRDDSVTLRLVVRNGDSITTVDTVAEYLPDILESVRVALIAAGFDYIDAVDVKCRGEHND